MGGSQIQFPESQCLYPRVFVKTLPAIQTAASAEKPSAERANWEEAGLVGEHRAALPVLRVIIQPTGLVEILGPLRSLAR